LLNDSSSAISTPSWDADRGEWQLPDGIIVKIAPHAKRLRGLIEFLDQAGWPDEIEIPVTLNGSQTPSYRIGDTVWIHKNFKDAVKGLNGKHTSICFGCRPLKTKDRSSLRVWWRTVGA
jgi:hypothetical protein